MSLLSKIFGRKAKFYRELLDQGAIILDVRSPQEYDQGHISEAKNIPLDQLKIHMEKIQAWNKPVITLCRSGVRSSRAASLLRAQGVEAHNGGAWDRFQQKVWN